MGSVQEIFETPFAFALRQRLNHTFVFAQKTLKTLAHTRLHTKFAELFQLIHPAYEPHVVQM
jgi:hypothetical protein